MSRLHRLQQFDKPVSDDFIYYDAIIYNPGPGHIQAEFAVNLADALLPDPSRYRMSIIKFSVPGYELPLFIFRNGAYNVALEYKGTTYQADVKYYPSAEANIVTDTDYYYSIYDYQTFITMINTALHSAFAAMKADQPGVPAVQPPYMVYDPVTTLFKMVAPTAYESYITDPITISFNNTLFTFFESFESFGVAEILPSTEARVNFIIQNLGQNQMYTTIPVLSPWAAATTYAIGDLVRDVGVDYICIAVSTGNVPASSPGSWTAYTLAVPNPPIWDSATAYGIGDLATFEGTVYVSLVNPNTANIPTATLGTDWDTSTATLAYTSTQEFATLSNWNDPKAIVFTTQSIPVVPEYLPVQAGVAQSGASNYLNVISDFDLVTPVGPEVRGIFVYLPTAQYRYITLNSQVPLTQLDFKLWWLDQQQVLHKMFVHPRLSISVKFLFEKIGALHGK